MKANELMIGDWISYIEDGNLYYARVSEVYKPSVFTEDGEFEGREVEEDEIIPVQITPEILEKNGFKKDYNGDFELIEEGYGIRVVRRGDVYAFTLTAGRDITDMVRFAIHQVGPFSVHWVQHALKLCGIELEIKL